MRLFFVTSRTKGRGGISGRREASGLIPRPGSRRLRGPGQAPLPIRSPARPAVLVAAPPHRSPRLRGVRVPPSFPKPRFPLPPAPRNQKNSGACCGPQPHVGAGPVPPARLFSQAQGSEGRGQGQSWKCPGRGAGSWAMGPAMCTNEGETLMPDFLKSRSSSFWHPGCPGRIWLLLF